MNTYSYKPQWRRTNSEKTVSVEVVLDPDVDWFASLHYLGDSECVVARYVLMSNGVMYWADAYIVTHKDICCCEGPSGAKPILIGSLARNKDDWRMAIVQYYMDGAGRFDWARGLLSGLKQWDKIVAVLGQDPLDKKSWSELNEESNGQDW